MPHIRPGAHEPTTLSVRTLIHYLLLAAVAAVLLLSSMLKTESHSAQAQTTSFQTLKINFQPAGAPTFTGYLVDSGAVYGPRGNGYSYGWSADNTSWTRDRNASSSTDQRFDTLNHMQKTSTTLIWQLAVPNGTYSVRIVAGDPLFFDSVFRITAEGALILSGTPTSASPWLDQTGVVTVNDGRLSISNGAGASNNKINFVVISAVPIATTTTPTRSPTHTPIATVPTKDPVHLTQTSEAATQRYIPPSTATAAVATTLPTASRTITTATRTMTPTPTQGGPSQLKVQYMPADTSATDNQIKPWLNVVNLGSSAVPLSELKLRYWYTREGTAGEQYACDYAVVNCSGVKGGFGSANGMQYFEVTFSGGTLAANSQTGEIKLRFNKTDWSNYNEVGDYSYDPSKSAYADWNRVTLYRNGTLIWGAEP